MKPAIQAIHHKQQGVAIIEALIAILIFSVGVLGIVGMQANMVKNTSDSQYRSEANYIAQQRIGAMWVDTVPIANLNNHVGLSSLTSLPGGQVNVVKLSNITNGAGTIIGGQFSVTVGWTAPGEVPETDPSLPPCFMTVAHCFSTISNIVGG